MTTLFTPRLELRPGSPQSYAAEPGERAALAAALNVTVPDDWPVEHYDEDPLKIWRAQILGNPGAAPWLARYLILRSSTTLIGMIGSGGPPVNGEYEVGYSILPAYRRRGYASEALGALLTWGFAQPGTEVVVAHTYPHLHASIGVLLKNGFSVAGEGREPGTIRYERRRPRVPVRVLDSMNPA